MSRLGLFFCAVVFLIPGFLVVANPPEDSFQKAIKVQAALSRARLLLNENDSQKAVQVLEENLRNVNGNNEYLMLLRDAYRAYVKDLYLGGQPALAKRYLDRLSILDPNAAVEPVPAPRVETPREPEVEASKPIIPFPKFGLPKLPNPFAKQPETKSVPPTAIRARAGEEDPFDIRFQREGTSEAARAQAFLATGIKEFGAKRYPEAKQQFEKAYQYDPTSLETCRDQWAYCVIRGISEQVDQSPPSELAELQRQVAGAVKMSSKVTVAAQGVLQQIEQRGREKTIPSDVIVKVKHLGANPEGWSVCESAHFRIFHRQDNAFGERVAQIAEQTRSAMYRKWFGQENVDWQQPCEVVMHPDGASYSRMTGEPVQSPGHSRIEADLGGRVISRRMDLRCDIRGMFETVLPHETTHTVVAGMFGSGQVPRWVDEGMAVLSETQEKIDQYRVSLIKNHQEGRAFGLKEMMELKNYPQPNRVPTFYAQSVILAEFLTAQKGPRVLPEFVKDSMRHGCETALQRHYGMNFTQLEQAWSQQVLSNSGRVAFQK